MPRGISRNGQKVPRKQKHFKFKFQIENVVPERKTRRVPTQGCFPPLFGMEYGVHVIIRNARTSTGGDKTSLHQTTDEKGKKKINLI